MEQPSVVQRPAGGRQHLALGLHIDRDRCACGRRRLPGCPFELGDGPVEYASVLKSPDPGEGAEADKQGQRLVLGEAKWSGDRVGVPHMDAVAFE